MRSEPGAGTTFSVYLPIGAVLPVACDDTDRATETSTYVWNILLT